MDIEGYVAEILEDIKSRGIEAVMEYSERFDGHSGELRVTAEEFDRADALPREDKEMIRRVIERVRMVHEKQLPRTELHEYRGTKFGLIYRPMSRVGLYVPGGRPLPSSLIMMGVPAKLAGVEEVVVVSPASQGIPDPYTLFIARELGLDQVYKIGGVQAIGAMAYGVGIKKVDKIFGPGNKYVTEAKRQVYGTVGIDCLAGPSEVCVIADETAQGDLVLMDLLSQVEHGGDSKAWLLSTSKELCDRGRREGVEVYHENSLEVCVERSNHLAPEHLQIMTRDPMALLPLVTHAGAVYLGDYTPASACDYFMGVNHVLPTGRAARFSSVLTVLDFMNCISLAMGDREDYAQDVDLGARLADIEGMEYHKRSMEARR